MRQSILIFAAIGLGLLFPQGHQLTFLIRYTLMIMLLFAFMDIQVDRNMFTPLHGWIALLNVCIPILLYFLFLPLGKTLALIAFLMGITPTAAGAPILAQFLKTDIGFVTSAVLINSPLMAFIIPILLPFVVPVEEPLHMQEILFPVLSIVGIPLLLSELIKRSSANLTAMLLSNKVIAFYLFLLNVWIASGKASHYLFKEQDEAWQILALIAVVTAITCLLNFKIGELLKRFNQPFAGGLAMGRKNTMFALWIALTFLNPVIVLGPIFYILFQNAYNSYQIMLVERRT